MDTEWLADIVQRLESNEALLERLDVQFSNLARRRGDRWELPRGPSRVSINATSALTATSELARSPIRFNDLADALTEQFPNSDRATVVRALAELVQHEFLITCLRAPLIIIDPLANLIGELDAIGAADVPAAGPLLTELRTIHTELDHHNHASLHTDAEKSPAADDQRAQIVDRMRCHSTVGRTPLAVDLTLDAKLALPMGVADEVARAASALLRLTRYPAGRPVWQDYHAAFVERYGIGALVPVAEVTGTSGIGYPAGYPGSVLPLPIENVVSERDRRLFALIWAEVCTGSNELMLTDQMIDEIAGDSLRPDRVPPHVEIAARIHASSRDAVDRGAYLLTVAPARAGGVLTSRFTPTTTGSGLEDVYRNLPVSTEGALPVQVSFPPAYAHAENVCRVPAYLPHVLSLGEHRHPDENIPIDDVAAYATHDRLHLVSLSRHRIIEPQVFHALDLDKQPPPLARFLAHLTRAYAAAFTVFDAGPGGDELPYLPRIRYGRAILAPARWRVTSRDLPPTRSAEQWQSNLRRWRDRWRRPVEVDLRDDDRSIRLNLDEPLHADLLRTHLMRTGQAVLTEPPHPSTYAWLGGRAHDIAFPLATTHPPAPSPLTHVPTAVDNHGSAQLPAGPDSRWLSVKLFSHRDHLDAIISHRLPALLADISQSVDDTEPAYWFVRYRSANETDHLRLRLRLIDPHAYGTAATALGAWSKDLIGHGIASRLALDTYNPELGRYGHGHAMHAAEAVFTADSATVMAMLQHTREMAVDPMALATLNMVHIATGLLGDDEGMAWLATQPTSPAARPDRTVASYVTGLVRARQLPRWPIKVSAAWRVRADTLRAYRPQVARLADIDTVLESLLHMHHNRAIGINGDHERTCRRLAGQAARAYCATTPATIGTS